MTTFYPFDGDRRADDTPGVMLPTRAVMAVLLAAGALIWIVLISGVWALLR